VRYWNITNKAGKGLRFEGIEPLEMQALNYTEDDLQPARNKAQWHSGDLIECPFTDLHIAARSMGVGCVNSWGAWPLAPYRVHAGNKSFSFVLVPVKK